MAGRGFLDADRDGATGAKGCQQPSLVNAQPGYAENCQRSTAKDHGQKVNRGRDQKLYPWG